MTMPRGWQFDWVNGPMQSDYKPCERCESFDEVHGPQCPEHPDYDPTPWCSGCGARRQKDCDCGPIADND